MEADLKATGAVLLSQNLRKQIRKMHEVDGCSVEEIAQMLVVPELIVQSVLDSFSSKPAPAVQTNGEPESEYAETLQESVLSKINSGMLNLKRFKP
jgi:transposase